MKEIGDDPSSSSQQTVEIESVWTIYDDISVLIYKDGETLKWVEVYYMLNKSNLCIEEEEPDDLQVFREIKKTRNFQGGNTSNNFRLCRHHFLYFEKHRYK
jgi:hypothetical protein